MEVLKYAVYKHLYNYAGMQVCTYAGMHVCKYEGIQVYK